MNKHFDWRLIRTFLSTLDHLVGGDRDDTLRRGFAAFAYPVGREAFAFRTDDLVLAAAVPQAL